MAEDTDFSALYRTLGIAPGCTSEQLRRAYRRAVARLHPDQHGGHGDVSKLQELNRMYHAAVAFERAHGRLPGMPAGRTGIPPAGMPGMAPGERASGPPPARVQAAADPAAADKAGIDRVSRYFILLALVAIAVLVLHALETGGGSPAKTDAAPPVQAAPAIRAGKITLGMDKAQVKAIQGAPLAMHEIRWDYGPSWIDFGCGGVVTDWYSSPLRPLRVATPHPSARDWDVFDAAPPPGC